MRVIFIYAPRIYIILSIRIYIHIHPRIYYMFDIHICMIMFCFRILCSNFIVYYVWSDERDLGYRQRINSLYLTLCISSGKMGDEKNKNVYRLVTRYSRIFFLFVTKSHVFDLVE